MDGDYTEAHLVEQPAIALLRDKLGWESTVCFDELSAGAITLGREAKRDVVLVD